MKILLVEDEGLMAGPVIAFLKKEGYVCEWAEDFDAADERAALYEYDCALIDISIPGGNGLNIVQNLKKNNPKTGIIIISAKNSLDDKIAGLDIGADDYISKPFHLTELNSRIKSVLRRRNFEGKNKIEFEEITINADSREVSVCNKPIALTKKEYDLLLFFIANKKRVLTKESIAEHLWGDNMDMAGSFDFIYSHIKNLRKKLLEKGGDDYIKTVYGSGYKFGIR